MTKRISVVIPVYNGANFIANAIDSVLNQTIKPYEIIVVNDGSTDDTANQLAKFQNLITVLSIPNGGVSRARNLGVQTSKGDFIAFLDADDVWYENKLASQMEMFQRFPEVGFMCCNYVWFSNSVKAKVKHFSPFENQEAILFDQPLQASPFEILLKDNIVGTCSNVIIKREVLDRVGLFNVSYKQSEDYDLWIRCSLATKVVLQSSVLLEKKTHDSNLTNNFLETLIYHEQVLINLQTNIQTKPHVEHVQSKYQSAVAAIRYQIGNLYYEVDKPVMAFAYFFKGLGTDLTVNNLKMFCHFFSRKLIRTLSFGLIKNKQMR